MIIDLRPWRHVRIGALLYAVYVVSPEKMKEISGDELAGWCDYVNCCIYLDGSECAQRRSETLMHEILHACFEVMGWEDDEDKVRFLTHLLLPAMEEVLA